MGKRTKIAIGILSVVLIAALTLTMYTLLGKEKLVSGDTYEYESTLKTAETVEEIVIDAKKDDVKWQNINPYKAKTATENREANKYAVYENQIKECSAEVYTYFGEGGLFIYATTDEPIVNATTFSPFKTSAFDFYLQSQASLNKLDNLFNFAVGANGNMVLRVRTIDSKTGKEGWEYRPCMGVKTFVSINEVGYSMESFIPWSTLNMEKPEYLQLATALSRCLTDQYEADRFWECFEYFTGNMSLTRSETYPLFDKNGYIDFVEGENFALLHNNLIDMTQDKGEAPQVTTLNRSTVTAFLKNEAAKDVYWESTVRINDYNYTDDPRVGLILRSEKAEDGSYSQVYLLIELDKDHKGDGYTIKDIAILPSNNKKNDWTKCQRFNMTSAVKDKEFKIAVLKQGKTFSFYLNDVLLGKKDDIDGFKADTKVICGATSWFTGATFKDYQFKTSGLSTIAAKKTAGFIPDNRFTSICFDMLTQKQGYMWAYSTKVNHATINFNQKITGDYTASMTVSDFVAYNGLNDGRQGFMLTKDLGGGKYRRMFVCVRGDKNNDLIKIESFVVDNDDFGEGWSKVTTVKTASIGKVKKATLTMSVVDGHAICYVDGKYLMDFDMTKYNMGKPDTVGLSSWRATAKISNPSLKMGTAFATGENFIPIYNGRMDFSKDYGTAPQVTSTDEGNVTVFLAQEATKNVYWETTVKINKFNNASDPRVGLLLRGAKQKDGSYKQVYLMLELDKNHKGDGYTIKDIAMLPSDNKKNDWNACQRFNLDSAALNDDFKLAVLKQGKTFSFYLNDVLLCEHVEVAGLEADTKVTCGVTAWYTGATFSGYKMQTNGLDAIKDAKTAGFVADNHYTSICFDMLTQSQKYMWAYSTKQNHATVNFNQDLTEDFSVTTTLSDYKSYNNYNDSRQGFMFTKDLGNGEYRRLFIGLRGNKNNELINLESYIVDNDFFGSSWEGVTTVKKQSIGTKTSATLKVSFVEGHAICYIDGVYLTDFDLKQYGMGQPDAAGLTSWRGTVKFSNTTLTEGADFAVGENFVPVYNGRMDFSKDTGKNPQVSANSVGSVTAFYDKEAVRDVYWETTVKITDFNGASDPRTGILLRGEKQTDGSYSQVYLLLELDKNYTGEGYKIKDIAVLPSNNKANDWNKCQRYKLTSAIADEDFKLGILKQGKTFSFYLNDVLLCERSDIASFAADTKVSCGITSWYTDTVFSDYKMTTKNLDTVKAGKASVFVPDYKKNSNNFDWLNEAKASGATVTTDESAWFGSILNWNKSATKKFYAKVTSTVTGNYNNGEYATGFVLTEGNNRFYVLMYMKAGAATLRCYSMTNEDFNNKKEAFRTDITLSSGANNLLIYRADNQLCILINDELQTVIDLSKVNYPITGVATVGLTSWKAKATFTDYELLTDGNYPFAATDISKGNHEIVLGTASKNIYAETTLKTTNWKSDMHARVGLRLTSADGTKNVDFGLNFEKNSNPLKVGIFTMRTNQSSPTATSSDVSGTSTWYGDSQYSGLSTLKNNYPTGSMKLAVAKVGNTFSFYINGKLLATKTFSGFDANEVVTPKVYSKGTSTVAINYKVGTPGTTIGLVKTGNSMRTATVGAVTLSSGNVANIPITITSPASDKRGYYYFADTNTKVYAETYVQLPATVPSSERAGLALVSEGNNAQIGFYLNAIEGKLNVYYTNTAVDGTVVWGDSVNVTNLTIGRNGSKLAVLRDGNTIKVYVNGAVAWQGTLSGNFSKLTNMTSTTKTKVGLSTLQGSATYYDYRVLYGDAVDAVSN